MNYIKHDFSCTNIQHFIQDLHETNWDFITTSDDVNDNYSIFWQFILQLYDSNFPQIDARCRINTNKSPWLNEGIYKSVRRKNYLYNKYLKNPTLQNKQDYTQYKNNLTGLIKKCNQEKNNIKGTWKLINSLLSKTKSKTNPSYFVHNGVKINDDGDIANAFNDYFVNIGNSIASNLTMSDCSFDSFLGDRCSHSLFFNPVTQAEIINVINKFPSRKAPGWDGISSFVIKQAMNALAKPLVLLFNKSISSGIFPDGLKTGKVIPIHKAGSKYVFY